jgi:xanthine dehydrogenase accessory factor
MIPAALSRRSQELAAARIPFVTATVVRAQSPASVEPGSVALVLADGTIDGFVGGVCAEQSVRAYSLIALQSGEPVLLRILPDGEEDGVDGEIAVEDGAVTVRNPCLSGGAIEVFLEPAPPAPRVLVVGDTPIAAAVGRIGGELELNMVTVGADGPEPEAGDLAVIVAGHGRDELHSLRRGLEAGVAYVGLVASPKRGAGVLDELRADGVADELLARIDVPAGIEIGSRTPGEIALSILAKVVETRRAGSDPVPRTTSPNLDHVQGSDPTGSVQPSDPTASVQPSVQPSDPAARIAVDPICGMTVAAVASTPSVERDGETFYFCCEGCKAKFEAQDEHASVAG